MTLDFHSPKSIFTLVFYQTSFSFPTLVFNFPPFLLLLHHKDVCASKINPASVAAAMRLCALRRHDQLPPRPPARVRFKLARRAGPGGAGQGGAGLGESQYTAPRPPLPHSGGAVEIKLPNNDRFQILAAWEIFMQKRILSMSMTEQRDKRAYVGPGAGRNPKWSRANSPVAFQANVIQPDGRK